MDILNATCEVSEFTLCGLILKGKVVELYDADTCKIVLPLHNNLYKFTCRLNGIDTPEMKPKKDKVNRDNEIMMAKKARNELLKMICKEQNEIDLNITKDNIKKKLADNKRLIIVKCLEFDKYGRLLVELYNENETDTFNRMLVNLNLAVSYNGGTKITPW